jgi:hypothetical protein
MYGGWSLDDISITADAREWTPGDPDVPTSLLWGATGAVSIPADNTGEAAWTSLYKLYEVSPDTTKINRWGVDNIAVSGTVAAGGSYDFEATITAPSLTTLVYSLPLSAVSPMDVAKSVLSCDWNLQNPAGWVPVPVGGTIAKANVTISRFPDIQPGTTGAWARFYVEELAGRVPAVVSGYSNGTYRPENPILRDAIAVYIQRAAGVPLLTATGTVFRDIAADYWAAAQIESCAAVGIIGGFPDGFYRPYSELPRDAMCKFIANGMLYAGSLASIPTATADPFPDVHFQNDTADPPTYAKNPFVNFVKACKDNVIVQGYSDGTFRPSDIVNRGQLSVFVWRAFMRDTASVVLLGGPSISAVDPNSVAYAGVSGINSVQQGSISASAYVVLDAVRFDATIAPLTVTFEICEGVGSTLAATPVTVTLDGPTLTAANAAAVASGVPYYNVVAAIPTTLSVGDYTLKVTVDGVLLNRNVALTVAP